VIRRLEAATEQQLLPKDDQELAFVTRLLQLAVGCRGMMRDKVYRFAGTASAVCASAGGRGVCRAKVLVV
jgi:hypothetical protein